MRTMAGDAALRADVAAVIFGVDGVIIDSVQASAGAWKSVLDPFLRGYSSVREQPFVPFDVCADYPRYMRGRSRTEAVLAYLSARGIRLPYDDLRGLAAHQQEFFLAEVRRHGVTPFRSTVAMIREVRRRGVRTATVSTERYGTALLQSAGVAGMFDIALDGLDVSGSGLPSHADAALLQQAVTRLGTPPRHTAVIAESTSGVAAARRCGFGFVVGVDRTGDPSVLRERGANAVITDLSELELDAIRMTAAH